MAIKLSQLSNRIGMALHRTQRAALFLGSPGIGKTEWIMDFCKSNNLGFVHESAPSLDSPDVRGYLVPHKGEHGPETRWLKPAWLVSIQEQIANGFDNGIIFFDEVPAGTRDFRKALMPLACERRIGEFCLPDGWSVWMAGNRTSDKAGADKLMAHESNKMAVFQIETDLEGWLEWAAHNSHRVHPMYAAFAQVRPGVVFNTDPPADPNLPRCTPRSFVNASQFHMNFPMGEMELSTETDVMEGVAAFMGTAATEFATFLNTTEFLPTHAEILANPMKAKLPPNDRLDAHYAAAQLVVHHCTDENTDPDQLFKYAMRLRKEMQVSVARQMLARSGGALLNSVELGKFIRDNSALIASSMAD